MEDLLKFVHLVFVGFVALIPPVNPIGTAVIVDPLLNGLDRPSRKAAALRISLYCLAICTGALLLGGALFSAFGISLPVVQLAGGILICRMGWQLLSSGEGPKEARPASRGSDLTSVEQLLFYPLAFPMTTGAGTISVLLTLSAHAQTTSRGWQAYLLDGGALLAAVVLMCVVIYLSYAFSPALLRRLGPNGEQVLNRLGAFLVFCVGIQIAVGGIEGLVRSSVATVH
jgi:multiple antibiotic resistance protein